jgi:hypothetical protein
MYKGGCLCGAVRFEIHGAIRDIIYCHCSQCRKAQGSAFATNGNVNTGDLRFLSGENNLTGYQSSEDQVKYFCKTCGSPIMSRRLSVTDKVRVRLGTIDSDIAERPEAHIFVGSRANWEDMNATLPEYDEYEQGRQDSTS